MKAANTAYGILRHLLEIDEKPAMTKISFQAARKREIQLFYPPQECQKEDTFY
jgi:hypothetical protein